MMNLCWTDCDFRRVRSWLLLSYSVDTCYLSEKLCETWYDVCRLLKMWSSQNICCFVIQTCSLFFFLNFFGCCCLSTGCVYEVESRRLWSSYQVAKRNGKKNNKQKKTINEWKNLFNLKFINWTLRLLPIKTLFFGHLIRLCVH